MLSRSKKLSGLQSISEFACKRNLKYYSVSLHIILNVSPDGIIFLNCVFDIWVVYYEVIGK